ncbi:hypothetical protein [Paraburkholderia caledonica]|uniref:hypothetical protein n=1 Tax=Paraburkholderia caledonica TaxID=134536 RepID=UPI00037F3EC7|nr:hypothetical protein [Paraburkholderia caledonica]
MSKNHKNLLLIAFACLSFLAKTPVFARDSGDEPDPQIAKLAASICAGNYNHRFWNDEVPAMKDMRSVGAAKIATLPPLSAGQVNTIGTDEATIIFQMVEETPDKSISPQTVIDLCEKMVRQNASLEYYFPAGQHHKRTVANEKAFRGATDYCQAQFNGKVLGKEYEGYALGATLDEERLWPQVDKDAVRQAGIEAAQPILAQLGPNGKIKSYERLNQACKAMAYMNDGLRQRFPATDKEVVLPLSR